MPLGLYKRINNKKFHRGDIVAVCLNKKIMKIGRDAGYLLPGLSCYPSAPLIKQIVAVPGDDILLKEKFIIINGKEFTYTTYKFDSQNRKLLSIPRGHYQKTNGYWLIGTHSTKSWDSRYWGVVDPMHILAKLQHIL